MRGGGLLGDDRTAAIVAIGGAMLIWLSITTAAAFTTGHPPFATSSWVRWDSHHYLSVAEHGYEVGSCEGVPHREPGDLCGNAGWFPGYPYLIRTIASTGVGIPLVARLISLGALLGTFAVLWTCFLSRRPRAQGLAAMALAGAFPGSVYHGAVFPTSLTVVAMLGCLALIDRRRWPGAGALGALATVMYSSGIAIGAVTVVPLLDRTVGSWKDRLRAGLWLSVPPAAAYVAVHLEMWRTTGRWSAWFEVQGAYDFAPTSPFVAISQQLHYFSEGEPWIAAQTLLLIVVMVFSLHAAWEHRSELSLGERAAVPLLITLWLVPLTLGGALSLWRAEALLLPAVVLVSRLRAGIVGMLAVASVLIAFGMARLFFIGTLI